MNDGPPPPSDFGQEIMHLVDRAVEGKILPDEAQALRLMVESLANDRREPVTEGELVKLLQETWLGRPLRAEAQAAARGLLQMTVITKLPHPVWVKRTDG